MTSEAWLFIPFLLLGLLHIMFVLYSSTRNGGLFNQETETATVRNAEDDAISCPDCGTHNEIEYRFCRECVSELPGGSWYQVTEPATVGRGIV